MFYEEHIPIKTGYHYPRIYCISDNDTSQFAGDVNVESFRFFIEKSTIKEIKNKRDVVLLIDDYFTLFPYYDNLSIKSITFDESLIQCVITYGRHFDFVKETLNNPQTTIEISFPYDLNPDSISFK